MVAILLNLRIILPFKGKGKLNRGESSRNCNTIWKLIWGLKIPPKVGFFFYGEHVKISFQLEIISVREGWDLIHLAHYVGVRKKRFFML